MNTEMRDDTSLPRAASTPTAGARKSGVGVTVIAGSVAAMVVVFALVTVGVGAVADSYAVGAVLGLFCAAWGGVGFGVMFSGALAVLREEAAESAR